MNAGNDEPRTMLLIDAKMAVLRVPVAAGGVLIDR